MSLNGTCPECGGETKKGNGHSSRCSRCGTVVIKYQDKRGNHKKTNIHPPRRKKTFQPS